MQYVLFQAVSETHGYAVEKMRNEYRIIYVRKEENKDGKQVLIKEATAYSNGKMHSYSSPFQAGHVIKTQILPLYKKVAA